jgi:hypothetical protein
MRIHSLCHPDRSLRSGGTPDSGCVQLAPTDHGELCVADAERRSVRRDSSLQQLSLRMTQEAVCFFCVILSAAKDLDARSDARRQSRKPLPITKRLGHPIQMTATYPRDVPRIAPCPMFRLRWSPHLHRFRGRRDTEFTSSRRAGSDQLCGSKWNSEQPRIMHRLEKQNSV